MLDGCLSELPEQSLHVVGNRHKRLQCIEPTPKGHCSPAVQKQKRDVCAYHDKADGVVIAGGQTAEQHLLCLHDRRLQDIRAHNHGPHSALWRLCNYELRMHD